MASKSEVGHKINVANFSAACTILEEMGPLYNPTNANITLEKLLPIKVTLTEQVTQLDAATANYRADAAEKENAISQMDKKATKINNNFKSLDVPDNEKENIANQVKKIRGDSKKPPANPEQQDDKTISDSQQSFNSKVANFNTLIAQLGQFREYAPNEDEIKIRTLQEYTQNLATLNNSVQAASNAVITARAARNNTIYFNDQNARKLIMNVKAYVRSLGDIAKPYYEALVRLKFSNIKQ